MGVHVVSEFDHMTITMGMQVHHQQKNSHALEMVDLLDEGAGVYPVEADVRVLPVHPLETIDYPTPVSLTQTRSRFGDYIDQAQLASTTVPDPLKLKGIGNATL